jgi:UDP-4-amino-4,6-dideoxy-N-acetyl-beta-L-altrosamine N-acetyltransferase
MTIPLAYSLCDRGHRDGAAAGAGGDAGDLLRHGIRPSGRRPGVGVRLCRRVDEGSAGVGEEVARPDAGRPTLRPATDADSEMVRRWRNHPQVRRSSLTTHEIGPEEHERWWRRTAADPTRRVLIFSTGGRPAGVVTLADIDLAEGSCTWGFYLDVAGLTERGALLPAWLELEKAVLAYAFDELGLTTLGGETLAWNTPVLSLHRRFGFTETRSYERDVDGRPQRVVWTELRRGETP